MSRDRFVIALLLLFVLAPVARGQEWTRFRGPDGLGVVDAKNLPVKFTEADFDWKTPLPGGGHSSPVVWGDKLFVTCADDKTAARTIVCLGAADGKIRWTREFPSTTYKKHGDNSYASPTPAVDAEHVYVVWSTPDELAVRAFTHDGKDAWKVDLGPYPTQHGGGASPIVFDDLVILPNDQDKESFLVALDAKTGAERWRTPRQTGPFSASTPSVLRPEGGPPQLVFTARSHGITGVDPLTGVVLWEVPDAFDSRTVASATTGAGLVFASCGEGGGGHWLVAVHPGRGSEKAAVVYKITEKSPYVPTPLVYKDLLFVWSDGGTVTCARAATGEQLWQERVGGSYFASPVCADGKLYNVSKTGEVVVLAATGTFQELGKSRLGLKEKVHATPAIAGGRMFFRTYTHLIAVGGKSAD